MQFIAFTFAAFLIIPINGYFMPSNTYPGSSQIAPHSADEHKEIVNETSRAIMGDGLPPASETYELLGTNENEIAGRHVVKSSNEPYNFEPSNANGKNFSNSTDVSDNRAATSSTPTKATDSADNEEASRRFGVDDDRKAASVDQNTEETANENQHYGAFIDHDSGSKNEPNFPFILNGGEVKVERVPRDDKGPNSLHQVLAAMVLAMHSAFCLGIILCCLPRGQCWRNNHGEDNNPEIIPLQVLQAN